ncbi:transglutaminase-like domain-containing protein [Actinoplanes xinjiangensis]|uniref:Transglutaminase superfamily protein n=1 Tax=Actinoplanes xinjiangensis TaxID=512350 RepID=A0A316FSY2_9ACTN|nr:transglutaminase family protein [Actinoplanes xinjiangensis]PWK51225.1 transglutaminase superfamily protein [Actinoplanes xinjiangensis]GIF39790.1 transglutaminase [Actinoplanes xinjiangensis]
MDISEVGCTLEFDVTEPAEIALQVAVSGAVSETLLVNGVAVDRQLITAGKGALVVRYSAAVPPGSVPPPVTDEERIVALRPSRYCPSDRLGGFAATRFGTSVPDGAGFSTSQPDGASFGTALPDGAGFGGSRAGDGTAGTVRAITDWVYEHITYQGGSSGPTTDAVDTLLAGAGVCRDFAHLTATLCRARNIPARVAAVYAPGLSPMDFHLVVETAIDGHWRVWDATRLAPRQSLIRIATGRDAADTAFATTLSGALTLTGTEILAVAGGNLPFDDHRDLVSLPG